MNPYIFSRLAPPTMTAYAPWNWDYAQIGMLYVLTPLGDWDTLPVLRPCIKGSIMKTVAAISFLDNHSLSVDVESVHLIEMTPPVELEAGLWTCNILIRAESGTVALQLLGKSAEALLIKSALE